MPEVVVFIGSDKDYESFLKEEIRDNETTIDYLELIRVYNSKIRATQDYAGNDLILEDEFDNVVVRSADFGSVVSHVISNFAMIATQGCTFQRIFVQNPPKQSLRSLESAFPEAIKHAGTIYPHVEKRSIKTIYKSLKEDVLGQDSSKDEITTSLYQLSSMRGKRPIVLLFYGPSGVGKTETAKCLAALSGGEADAGSIFDAPKQRGLRLYFWERNTQKVVLPGIYSDVNLMSFFWMSSTK